MPHSEQIEKMNSSGDLYAPYPDWERDVLTKVRMRRLTAAQAARIIDAAGSVLDEFEISARDKATTAIVKSFLDVKPNAKEKRVQNLQEPKTVPVEV